MLAKLLIDAVIFLLAAVLIPDSWIPDNWLVIGGIIAAGVAAFVLF